MLSCDLPPHCSRSRPYTLKQALTAHLLRAFSLRALDPALSRKPIFDLFLQTSVLGLDTLGGVGDTGCIHNLVLLPWTQGYAQQQLPRTVGKLLDICNLHELWAKVTPLWTKAGSSGPASCLPQALMLDSSSLGSLKRHFLGLAEMVDQGPLRQGQVCGLTPQLSSWDGQEVLDIFMCFKIEKQEDFFFFLN